MKLDELVEKYIRLRDEKAKIKAEYDTKVAGIDTLLDKMEAVLLKTFQDAGIESIKTAVGTAYKSTRVSTTVADWDIFIGHVKANEAFELLERRVSKEGVKQYRAANDDLPPGVNWREEIVVNVRR